MYTGFPVPHTWLSCVFYYILHYLKKGLWKDAYLFIYNVLYTLGACSLFYRLWKQVSLPQVYTNITPEEACPLLLVILIAS